MAHFKAIGLYTWRKRFGALEANDVRRLKQLKAENARLKKLVAERDLEIEVHTMPASFGGRHCIRDCLTVEHRLPSVSNQPRFGILE